MSTSTNITAWLAGDVVRVAREMVGWTLLVDTPAGTSGGIIVETEAYRAADDPACHAYQRRTPRTAPLFMRGGHVYVYLSYGLHAMLNISTGPDDEAMGVLIRAIEPTRGTELMATRRKTDDLKLLAAGPARLTKALGVELGWSGEPLGAHVRLIPPKAAIAASGVVATTRIGITRGTELPWRFLLAGSPFVSRPAARIKPRGR